MRLNILAMLASVAALFVTTAHAQSAQPDYVFTVPVRIENAPPFAGHQGRVSCTVQSMSVGRSLSAGEGSTSFNIGPSGYRGSVRVEVRLMEGVSRNDTWHWDCALWFSNVSNRAGVSVPWGTPNTLAALPMYPVITGQAVASSSLQVQADIRH